MAQTNLILTKESTSNEIKSYFSAILELSKSENEFPINLDEVWMLVYTRKSDAVEALQNSSFIEGVDYQVLRKNPQNPNGGRPTVDYYLTVPCLEFFIARRIRPVFEVYRQVFHGAAKMASFQVPKTFAEALMLAAQQQQQLEVAQAEQVRLQLEVQHKDTIIQEQAVDVAFAQTIKASDMNIRIGDFAKVLASNGYIIGPNRLFDWMRENGFIYGEKNCPVQRYIDMGLFTFHEGPVRGAYHRNGKPVIGLTPYITPKGQHYIIERLNDGRLYMERQIQKPQPQQLSINY